ncbi:group 3 secretory phospholipase A2-like [Stegastes partitus]|uniref:phospholipase A2 n=1 Tax=Stegastes partitus TaxID=144197 RepID=A0A9Y4JPZ3_9TELE|nr:PREDICTED: group 3 secretory phospholipase A2-like [Stegastes partitus]
MKSRCVLRVAFVLSSLVLSKTQNVIGPELSCLTSSLADGKTRVTFLRQDAAGARYLYLSLWSEDLRLLTCEVNSNPFVTERYRTLCDRNASRTEEISQTFNMSVLLAPNAPCAFVSSSAQKFTKRTRSDGTERKTRRKRAWILPGTLWCGSGSKAGKFEQLGMFESADRCCREHDHCLHIIPAFTVNYGVFNPNLYTVSHCECDQRFRQCLMSVNDSISSMVGYSFFNILQVPCFELKQQKRCTEMYWWGMCKAAKVAPYAIFQSPLPYNTSNVAHKHTDSNKLTSIEGQQSTESPMITPHRKSPKAERRCGFREPPRGDTFYRKRTKGRGCKRHRKLHGVAPSRVHPLPGANTTTLSIKTGLLNASNKKRAGKNKSIKKGLLDYISPHVTTTSQLITSTSALPLTQRPKRQHLPAAAITTAITKNHKKFPKRRRCCESEMPVRGDTFHPRCKNCLKQATTSHMTTVTPTKAATNGLPFKGMTHETPKKTRATPKPDTLVTLWNAATFTTPTTTKLKTIASFHKDGKPKRQVDSYVLQNNTTPEPVDVAVARSTPAERSLRQNNNMTDTQLLCGSLKHLDECKFKIPPLEKKYDLQNMESKTAYHCDCTSRLAVQIEGLKQPSILPSLLVDFISQQCFTLPKEKKCHRKKSCSRGFTKASDLHQALKKIEEKDTAGVRISGYDRKRGIPVRLYKRCLRLERRADIMAQLR